MSKPVSDRTFKDDVLGAGEPVLVDFYADWCGPCKAMAPALEELAGETAGRLTVAKLDVDASPETAVAYGVRSIPTLILFKDGAPVATRTGAVPKAALKAWVEASLAA